MLGLLVEIAILTHSLTSYRHGRGCMLILLHSAAVGQILVVFRKMTRGLPHSKVSVDLALHQNHPEF